MSEDLQSILRTGFEEFRDFVNPLIYNRAKLAREPLRFLRAENGGLRDEDGQFFEDFHGTQAFGHRRPEIAKAIRDFLDTDAPNWFPSRVNPFAGRLARRLCERSEHYERVYFACSGADAVEASLKLARAATRKPRILALDRAYHGCTFGAVSIMHEGPFTHPFAPHLQGTERIPFGDLDALAKALKSNDVCAVVVEPIQGEGGVRPLPSAYVEALCSLTEKHQALLIADEVQTGMGRSGHFIYSKQWPRRPDAVLLAKQLGGGLAPISAMLTTARWWDQAYGKDFEDGESHNMTMSYNAITAVASLAALELLDETMLASIRNKGAFMRSAIHEALQGSPLFVETRGEGFLQGLQLKQPEHPWVSFDQFGYEQFADRASIGPLFAHRMYRRGFFAFVCGHDWSVLRLQPRFDIPQETLALFAKVCREELDYLESLT